MVSVAIGPSKASRQCLYRVGSVRNSTGDVSMLSVLTRVSPTGPWPCRCPGFPSRAASRRRATPSRDRKSTRLNSSHGYISYAVFCLKKTSFHGLYRMNHSKQENNIFGTYTFSSLADYLRG